MDSWRITYAAQPTLGVEEIEERLGLLEPSDRALWALGFYGGLRPPEIEALRPEDVRLSGIFVACGSSSLADWRVVPNHRLLAAHLPYLAENSIPGDRRVRDGNPAVALRVRSRRALRVWERHGLPTLRIYDARRNLMLLLAARGASNESFGQFFGLDAAVSRRLIRAQRGTRPATEILAELAAELDRRAPQLSRTSLVRSRPSGLSAGEV